jgi:hypothetical protein
VQPAVSRSPRWWLWPTILSLDAPAVALLWQAMLARSASATLGAPERYVLGCSVWLAYAADRWIEAWRLRPEQIQTHRHHFHLKWRWEIFAVWVAVLVLDVAVALRGLSSKEFGAGLILLAAVTAYLLSHQLIHRANRWRAPKEACVALLLGAGAALFIPAQAGAQSAAMALPLALFVLLCFANCAVISLWESEVDLSHGATSLATQYAWAAQAVRSLPWLIAALSAGAWFIAGPAARPAASCAAASGILLGLVDVTERRIGRFAARVLADVALMTPAVAFLLGTFR